MRRIRVRSLLRASAVVAVAALGAGSSAAVVPVVATAAVQMTPFITGHVLVSGLSAPPTTAQCETKFGIACYQASQLQTAYNLGPLFAQGDEGQGETIAIVDAFGSPSIASDLKTFDKAEGLPNPPSFKVITPVGPITTNAKNCTSTFHPTGPDLCSDYYGWTDETSLDVEWAHTMAPKANILLVETPDTETEGIYGFPQIVAAENYVIDHHLADVITQSFGAGENTFTSAAQIQSLRSAYFNAAAHGVTVLAASGDQGSSDETCTGTACADPNSIVCCDSTPTVDWPSTDPLVTAVGGTQLTLNAAGQRTAPDQVWDDLSSTVGVTGPVYTWGSTGGGHSAVFDRPAFQNGVAGTVGATRGTPDISMSAAVNGAVDYYDTSDPGTGGWNIVGGTSEASPLFSGIVALADQVAGHRLGDINPALYYLGETGSAWSGIVPISKGSNAYTFCIAADVKSNSSCKSSSDLVTVPGATANGTYNNATGWGTVNAAVFVPALAHAARYNPRHNSQHN